MKAMVLSAIREPLELRDVPIPEPGANELLLRVKACGSGLTLHHTVNGSRATKLPVIIGHEVLGQVVRFGSQVQALSIGDYVALYASLFCGQCRMCRTSREPLCERSDASGIGRQRDGGYAEYMTVPVMNCVPVPTKVVEQHGAVGACVMGDAMVTPYKTVRHTSLKAGEVCVIFGAAGGVGIHLIQLAKHSGAHVIGIDIGADKIAAMLEQGADHAIDARELDPAKEVRQVTGGYGADVVADFVGTNATLRQGVDMLAMSGRLSIIGLAVGASPEISAIASTLLYGERAILGSRSFSRQDLADCVAMVANGAYRPVVNHVYPLEQANDAHALVASGRSIGRVALTVSD